MGHLLNIISVLFEYAFTIPFLIRPISFILKFVYSIILTVNTSNHHDPTKILS